MGKIPQHVIDTITNDEDLLIRKLAEYGINPSRVKNKYNCVHCGSSDALSIALGDEGYYYHCFNCHVGGNVLKLIERMKADMIFPKNVIFLANELGIELPNVEYTPEQKAKFEQRKQEREDLEKFKLAKLSNLDKIQKKAYEAKDLETALRIESYKEEIKDIKFTEKTNYTKYKADKTYHIDKYISEQIEGLEIALNKANDGKKVLVIAPTGSGKTDTTIKSIKPNELYKASFISPNASNVEQIMNKYDIPGAFGTELNGDVALQGNNIACMTWDKFTQLKETDLSNYVGIVDEIHQTFTDMYRKDKIKGLYGNLSKCKGQIDITATPNKLDIASYDYIVEYKQKIQTNYNVFLYDNINDSKVLEIINKSTKFILLENNTKNLEYYHQSTDKETDVITANNKEAGSTYDNIMRNESIGDLEGIFNTSVIVAGVNIYDPDVTDIIVIGEKDLSMVRQYPPRIRGLESANVHIFNTYKEFSKTYSLEWKVSEVLKGLNMLVAGANYYLKATMQEETTSLKGMKLDDVNHVYYDEEVKEYKVDVQSVRHEVYTNYYNNADITSYKQLLEEYFPNVTIVNVKEDKSKAKKTFKEIAQYEEEEARDILFQYRNILVGANELLRAKASGSLKKYLSENNINKDDLLEQYKEQDIVGLIAVGKNKSFIDLYSKYVVENGFTYDMAWSIAEMSPQKRKYLFNSLNKIVFRDVQDKHPYLISNNLLENRIYNQIVREFTPGVAYTREHVEFFIDAIKIAIPDIKLSTQKVIEVIKENYVVECKQYKKGTKVPDLTSILYKNIVPKCGTFDKKTNIYTIGSPKNVEDIVKENELSDFDSKILKKIVERRYNKYTESDEAKHIIDVCNIFAS